MAALTAACLWWTPALAQNFTLTGKVVDEQHNPVELASVACPEQGKATMTDLKGQFSIQLNSNDSVVVKFSMVGYQTKKRVFRNPKGKLSVEINLNSLESMLGEVVVTEKRRQTSHRTA